MAISIYQNPKPVSLVGDPILVDVLTTSHLVAGQKTIIEFFSHFQEDSAVSFEFENGTITETFYFVDTISGPYDILNPNILNLYAWTKHIAERLAGIYTFSSLFNFSVVAMDKWYGVRLESKNTEPITLQIIRDPEYYLNGGFIAPLIHSYQMGVEVSIVPGYMLGINIYNQNAELIAQLTERPPFDGIVRFEISELLEALPNPSFNLEAGILSYTDACVPYKFEIYEKYGIPAIQHDKQTSEVFYAIYGKSSFIKGAKWNEDLGSFYNEIITNKSFLTLQPNNKKISPFAPELLSFLIFDATLSTVKLHLNVTFTDGTSTEVDKGTLGAIFGRVMQVNISPDKLQLFEVDTAKTVHNYSVVLRNQANIDISQERTYIIDYETYDYLRFFIFLNDYGGSYECMRSTGTVKNIGKIDKEFGNAMLPYDYTSKARQETQVSAKRILEFDLNWGLLSKNGGEARDWKNFIQQIELSYDVFEYINSLCIACSFITDKYDLHDDNKRIYTHASTYRRAFVDEAYSDDDIPITGDYSDDFNDDYFN